MQITLQTMMLECCLLWWQLFDDSHALSLCNAMVSVDSTQSIQTSIQIKTYFASYLLFPLKYTTFLEATSASYSWCFQNESASSSSSTTDAGQQRCRKHSFENQLEVECDYAQLSRKVCSKCSKIFVERVKNLNTTTADKNVSTMDDFKHMEKKGFLPTVVVSGKYSFALCSCSVITVIYVFFPEI